VTAGLHACACAQCKEPFWLTAETGAALRRSNHTFHCPWGHENYYPKGQSESDKLRLERDRLKQEQARLHQRITEERELREASERRVSAAKGRITRLKNRAATGHCPCCNRVFVDLLSHMKSKHADYEAQPIDLDAEEPTQ
jgi:hypothetical protein